MAAKSQRAQGEAGCNLEDYRPVVGDEAMEEILGLAEPLRGARVLHLSVLSFGTATSDLLDALLPLMSSVGLYAEWQAIQGTSEQRAAITAMYRALGGEAVRWTSRMRDRWLEYCNLYADHVSRDYDFVVVHDPQPAAVLSVKASRDSGRPGGSWIWHCHLDLSTACPEVWSLLHPHLQSYDAIAYSAEEYVRPDLKARHLAIIPPAIDPLSPRNTLLANGVVADTLHRYGLDPERPVLVQVARLDRWSDPLGGLEIYRLAKIKAPDLQLLLVAMMRPQDPDSRARYEKAAQTVADDPDAHVFTNLDDLSAVEVNAFQTAGRVVLQTGLRKGYDLHVLEAMWKGRPVVADRLGVGFSPDGVVGLLSPSPQECADGIVSILRHPGQAAIMGKAAQAYVRRQFLVTRYLRDYLRLFVELVAATPPHSN